MPKYKASETSTIRRTP